MATVEDGRALYRSDKAGHQRDPEQVYQARPGSTDYGRLLRLPQTGDQRAEDIVRRWAARGNETAGDVLGGAGAAGPGFGSGSEPGSYVIG